jgi:hypothetical protein
LFCFVCKINVNTFRQKVLRSGLILSDLVDFGGNIQLYKGAVCYFGGAEFTCQYPALVFFIREGEGEGEEEVGDVTLSDLSILI